MKKEFPLVCGNCTHPKDGHQNGQHECMYELDCECMEFEPSPRNYAEPVELDGGGPDTTEDATSL